MRVASASRRPHKAGTRRLEWRHTPLCPGPCKLETQELRLGAQGTRAQGREERRRADVSRLRTGSSGLRPCWPQVARGVLWEGQTPAARFVLEQIMKQSKTWSVAFLASTSVVVGPTILAACSASNDTMHGDGTAETKSGYTKSRAGLDRLREGSTTFKAGNSAGLDIIRAGVLQFSDGLDMMRSGLGMMSGDMMGKCGGSPDKMMDGLDKGMAAVREGLKMVEDADPKNDGDGMGKMDSGIKMGEDGMRMMDGATSCMGHGNMM